MIDDDDAPSASDEPFPRNLERMSIDALRAYITALEAEIARVRDDIARKEALRGRADDVFSR